MAKDVVKLTLYKDLEDGGTAAQQVIIRKLKFRFFNRTLAIVSQILEAVDQNPETKAMLLEMFFGTKFDRELYADLEPEVVDEMEEQWKNDKDVRFFAGAVAGFRVLLTELPDLAMELLAQMANIDLELLLDQELETGFDIVDAILEVNDIEELVVRGKQSSRLARKAFAFMAPKNSTVAEENQVAAGPVNVLRQ